MFVRDLRILASSVVNTGQPDNAGLSPALPAWPDGRAGQSTRDSRKGSTAAALAATPGLRGPLFPTPKTRRTSSPAHKTAQMDEKH